MSQATMKKSPAVQLEAPRSQNSKALRIAGLRERYTSETMKNIPELWGRFGPHIGKIPGQVGRVAYGLCFNALSPNGIDYLAGVEVSSAQGLPGEFSVAAIPAPKFFECYSEEFDPRTGMGGMEVWMPIKS